MEVHIRSRLLFDLGRHPGVWNSTPITELEKWMRAMNQQKLQGIRQVHAAVKYELLAYDDLASRVLSLPHSQGWWFTTSTCSCRIVELRRLTGTHDPLFKLELEPDNKTIHIRTFCRLIRHQEQGLRKAIQTWTKLHSATDAFTGLHLLNLIHLISEVEACAFTGTLQAGDHKCRTSDGRLIVPIFGHAWAVEAKEENLECVARPGDANATALRFRQHISARDLNGGLEHMPTLRFDYTVARIMARGCGGRSGILASDFDRAATNLGHDYIVVRNVVHGCGGRRPILASDFERAVTNLR